MGRWEIPELNGGSNRKSSINEGLAIAMFDCRRVGIVLWVKALYFLFYPKFHDIRTVGLDSIHTPALIGPRLNQGLMIH